MIASALALLLMQVEVAKAVHGHDKLMVAPPALVGVLFKRVVDNR